MATERSDRRLGLIVLGALALVVLVPALGMGFGMMGYGSAMGHGMWGDGGRMPGWALLVGVGMQLLWLLVVVGAVYLGYRALAGRGDRPTDRALEELRLAYARGELSDEEYERRRDRLESDR